MTAFSRMLDTLTPADIASHCIGRPQGLSELVDHYVELVTFMRSGTMPDLACELLVALEDRLLDLIEAAPATSDTDRLAKARVVSFAILDAARFDDDVTHGALKIAAQLDGRAAA